MTHKRKLVLIFTVFFVVFTALFFLIFHSSSSQQKVLTDSTGAQTPNASDGGMTKPLSSPQIKPSPDLIPATFIIPKLDIQTAVEPVGITETENMDVPKNADNVAWYMHGAKPSEDGNAVIAGHFDTPTGAPAVFYKLSTLKAGDEVEVISQNGVRSIFIVDGIDKIPYDKFPNEFVFKTKPGKNLNLITCGGVWDRNKKNYSDRIVVYTSLKEVKS